MNLEKWEVKQKQKALSNLLLHFEYMLSYQKFNKKQLDKAFEIVQCAYEMMGFKFKESK